MLKSNLSFLKLDFIFLKSSFIFFTLGLQSASLFSVLDRDLKFFLLFFVIFLYIKKKMRRCFTTR